MSGLWGGYTAANVLKWYWWRLNGYGFFVGMLVGMIGALAMPALLRPAVSRRSAPDVFPLYSFPAAAAAVDRRLRRRDAC